MTCPRPQALGGGTTFWQSLSDHFHTRSFIFRVSPRSQKRPNTSKHPIRGKDVLRGAVFWVRHEIKARCIQEPKERGGRASPYPEDGRLGSAALPI